jgi:hypothetical protein
MKCLLQIGGKLFDNFKESLMYFIEKSVFSPLIILFLNVYTTIR